MALTTDIKSLLPHREPFLFVDSIISAIKETLEVTLPELSADIIERGIYLTGGASRLRGLGEVIEREIKIPVITPENPENCVALGTSIKLRRTR